MAIVVVGAGAIGLLVAGKLAQTTEQVALLARPRAAAALATGGVITREQDQIHTARNLLVLDAPERLAQSGHAADLAILCVKGYDTAAACDTLAALQPGRILTLQNGIGNEEVLIERFGAERVIAGAITTSVEVDDTNTITITKTGGIGLAPVAAPTDVSRWAQMFAQAGFEVRTYQDYRALKWSKALLNMLGNASAAILDLPVEEVYTDRRMVALERRAVLEALLVMNRMGARPVNLPRYPAVRLARSVRFIPFPLLHPMLKKAIAGGRGGKPPSLHIELLRGNPRSEGAFLYGAIARTAATLGVSAPVNAALWETLNGIATGTIPWEAYRHQPEQLLRAVEAQR